jgi:hypothetical protein
MVSFEKNKGVLFVKRKGKNDGIYYHKLNKIFISITFVFLFMLLVYSALFIRQQKKENDITITNVAVNKIQLYTTSFEIIQNKIDMFKKSDKLSNWIESDNQVEKAFALIKLYKDITTRTSILGEMDYSITVIDPFFDKVVCSGGTYDIENYLKNESGMNLEALSKTISSFETSDGDMMQPLYDDNNKLSELYLFSKASFDKGYVIVDASIRINKILQNQNGINIGFVSPIGDILEGEVGSFSDETRKQIVNHAHKTNLNDINVFDNHFFLKQLKGLPWTTVVEMVPNNEGLTFLVIILVTFILLITMLIYFVGMRTKAQLYSPIKAIVDENNNSEDSIVVENNDEFAFFKSMNERVHTLTTELQDVLEKQDKLILQKYNLDLIEGRVLEKDKDDTTNLFVGYMGEEAKRKAIGLTNKLRLEHIRTTTDLMGKSVKTQMKYANKIQAKYSFIIGETELETMEVKVKNMDTGEQESMVFDQIGA